MGKGTVFISPLSAKEKRRVIFEEIVSICPDSNYSSVLYITPASFSLNEAKRQFFSYLKARHKKNVYVPFQSFTLKDLCIHLYTTNLSNETEQKRIISDRIEPFILCKIMGEDNIGYAYCLSDLLSKLRHYILNKDLSHIKEHLKLLISEEKVLRRAVKAIEILEAYEKRLKEKGLIDFEGAIKESIPLIKSQIQNDILVLDGFLDPTPLELEIITALAERIDKVYVLIEENAEFAGFFKSRLADKNWEIRSKNLKAKTQKEGMRYYSYPTLEDEVEGIAKGIKGLIIEGIKPSDIIVSFPVLSKYLPMLKRVFKKHGIPISIVEDDLYKSKPFIALEDMIASIEEDYLRTEFLSFLTSPFFPNIPKTVKNVAVSISNKAGIIKGKEAWLSIKDILLNAEEEVTEEMEGFIKEFQLEINKVIERLEGIKKSKNLPSFIDKLEEVLNKLGFFDSLEKSDIINKEDILEGVENILSELRTIAEFYSSEAMEFKIEKAGLYLRHLMKGLKGKEENIDGVRVVPFELAAGIECEEIFFGGMIEGDLPSKPGIDPILPENVKKNMGLPFLEYYLDRQKRYFERLLNISSRVPYFSHPSTEGDKVFLPSPFLAWDTGLTPQSLNIVTEEDILIRKGALKQKDFSVALWDGKLSSNEEIKNLFMQRFGDKTYLSVTEIDAYRQCPLRFYIERFLCLKIEKPPQFEVEAILWGKLAHKTMEYLFKDGDIKVENMDKKLLKGLEISLRELSLEGFWAKVARRIFVILLPSLKEEELNIRMQGYSPYIVEKTLKTTINNISLKGKIDRVDKKKSEAKGQWITDSGQQDTVILLDYKTSSIDKDSFQLPLYAAMWQREMQEEVERVGYYSLKNGQIEWLPKKGISMAEFIDNALLITEEIVKKMREGIFTPTPFKDTECWYCKHSTMCKTQQ